MSDSQNAFAELQGETLEEKALRVCGVIASSGLGIRGGQITIGDDMVAVENAVKLISLEKLKQSINREEMGDRRFYIADLAYTIIRKTRDNITYTQPPMHSCVSLCVELSKYTNMEAKPVNYDLNAAGVKRETYVEPEGLAKEFVDAFDIGYKSPSKPKPKPKTKTKTPTGAK